MNKASSTTGRRPVLVRKIYDLLYEAYGPQHWWPAQTVTEVVIGAILTQNTAWGNVERAVANLRRADLLDLSKLHRVAPARLAAVIRPCGTYRVKARRLKAFVSWLHERFGGRLEAMFAVSLARIRPALLDVNGIGPETADAILLYAGRLPTFVIDAYTKRVLRRHRLIPGGATYEDAQRLFERNLPRAADLYNEYHALLVAVGKRHCRVRALCRGCPLEQLAHDETL